MSPTASAFLLLPVEFDHHHLDEGEDHRGDQEVVEEEVEVAVREHSEVLVLLVVAVVDHQELEEAVDQNRNGGGKHSGMVGEVHFLLVQVQFGLDEH